MNPETKQSFQTALLKEVEEYKVSNKEKQYEPESIKDVLLSNATYRKKLFTILNVVNIFKI